MKMNNVRYLSGKEIDEMVSRGWWLKLAEFNESPEKIFDRLSQRGVYSKIKVYYTSTMVRGSYKYFAMVKR